MLLQLFLGGEDHSTAYTRRRGRVFLLRWFLLFLLLFQLLLLVVIRIYPSSAEQLMARQVSRLGKDFVTLRALNLSRNCCGLQGTLPFVHVPYVGSVETSLAQRRFPALVRLDAIVAVHVDPVAERGLECFPAFCAGFVRDAILLMSRELTNCLVLLAAAFAGQRFARFGF